MQGQMKRSLYLRGPVQTGDDPPLWPTLIIEQTTERETGATLQISERRGICINATFGFLEMTVYLLYSDRFLTLLCRPGHVRCSRKRCWSPQPKLSPSRECCGRRRWGTPPSAEPAASPLPSVPGGGLTCTHGQGTKLKHNINNIFFLNAISRHNNGIYVYTITLTQRWNHNNTVKNNVE